MRETKWLETDVLQSSYSALSYVLIKDSLCPLISRYCSSKVVVLVCAGSGSAGRPAEQIRCNVPQPCAREASWVKTLWWVWVAALLWLLPDPSSSCSLTHSSSATPSFRLNHPAKLGWRWWSSAPQIPLHSLTAMCPKMQISLTLHRFRKNPTQAVFANLFLSHMRALHYVMWIHACANRKDQQTQGVVLLLLNKVLGKVQ